MKNNTFLPTLGLCRRAGKVAMGYDPSIEVIYKGTAAVVLLASDLSPKSAKGIHIACESSHTPCIAMECTMDEISGSLGKRVGIVAITDSGFATKLRSLL